MSDNNSKPHAAAPVVTLHENPSNFGRYMILLIPSLFGSIIVHVVLLGVFFLLMLPAAAGEKKEEDARDVNPITADQAEDQKATFSTVDVDPAATEFDTDINYMNDRIA